MPEILRKWGFPLGCLVLALFLGAWRTDAGMAAGKLFAGNVLQFLSVLPPVFVLLGLFDAWIPRERVSAHMGESSGIRGAVLSVFLGAFAAGPLYIAFPMAEVMLRKGTSLRNVFIFVGAWSTMKIPMFLFEIQSLGLAFGLSRYVVSLAGILLMAVLLEKLLGEGGKEAILARYRES